VTAPWRTALLSVAALLALVGAFGNALVIVPDVHGDLVDIGVRPAVLNASVDALHAAALAGFAFAVIVSAAAIQSARGVAPAAVPLAAVAVVSVVQGTTVFARTHSPHHVAPIAIGILIAAALTVGR
jgi:hypothetical protein